MLDDLDTTALKGVACEEANDDESLPEMQTPSKIWYLKRCDLFEKLTPEQSERVERRASMRRFSKGALIYAPGDPCRNVMLVARGRVKIKGITPDGKEFILAFIEEGELFGELALLDEAPRGDFAEADDATELLAIPREVLFQLVEDRPDIAFQITKLVGLRRKRIESRLRNILFRNNRQRVAGVLLELLESHGERDDNGWLIRLRLSHQEIASLIGATRETVTIILGELQLDGLIRVRRRAITVVDREGLSMEAGV
jgi:CRP/FNR family transcriptional regulator, cyclic AMP receptor protein